MSASISAYHHQRVPLPRCCRTSLAQPPASTGKPRLGAAIKIALDWLLGPVGLPDTKVLKRCDLKLFGMGLHSFISSASRLSTQLPFCMAHVITCRAVSTLFTE